MCVLNLNWLSYLKVSFLDIHSALYICGCVSYKFTITCIQTHNHGLNQIQTINCISVIYLLSYILRNKKHNCYTSVIKETILCFAPAFCYISQGNLICCVLIKSLFIV